MQQWHYHLQQRFIVFLPFIHSWAQCHCLLHESSITQSQVFVKHLSEGVSQKASLWSIQLPLLIFFFGSLPRLLIAQLPEEGLRHLGGVRDVCVHPVCTSLPLSLLQTLDKQPAQALPAVPAARHQPADPPDVRAILAFPEDAAEDITVAVCNPDLPRCHFPLWGDLLCWNLFVLVFWCDSAPWLSKRKKIIWLQDLVKWRLPKKTDHFQHSSRLTLLVTGVLPLILQ